MSAAIIPIQERYFLLYITIFEKKDYFLATTFTFTA